MKTDKRKLLVLFREKADRMCNTPDFVNRVIEARQEWMRYVNSLGCEIVKTPNGMLPFHSPHFVHIVDPWELPDKDWHIRIPKNLALKILTIGLP